MMTTNSCAAHAVYRESQTPHEDIRPSRAAGDAVLEFGSRPSQRWRARLISRPPHARRALRSLLARIDAAGSK